LNHHAEHFDMTLSFAATATHELRLNEQVLLVTHELNAHQLFVKLTGLAADNYLERSATTIVSG
jgi:hypothetical protein